MELGAYGSVMAVPTVLPAVLIGTKDVELVLAA